MKRIWSKWLKRIGVVVIVLFSVLWLFSPYRRQKGFEYPLIKNTVGINAPVDSVFMFLGNSANAAKWSVFIHHITTLNASAVADGQVGSQRRCFRYANEKGTRWDEVITQVVADNNRQIRCYNLIGFPISSEGLGTEQLYRPLGPDKCALTFTLYYTNRDPSWLEELKIKFAGFFVKGIFIQNMNNIKRMVETRRQQK